MINQAVYEKLKDIARQKSCISYSEIAAEYALDPNWHTIGDPFGEISKQEHELGRPLLSVVVVHKKVKPTERRMPGTGFFTLAEKLGVKSMRQRNEQFFAEELKRVYDYWENH